MRARFLLWMALAATACGLDPQPTLPRASDDDVPVSPPVATTPNSPPESPGTPSEPSEPGPVLPEPGAGGGDVAGGGAQGDDTGGEAGGGSSG